MRQKRWMLVALTVSTLWVAGHALVSSREPAQNAPSRPLGVQAAAVTA